MPDLHPSAVSHLPWFITAPGETDYLLVGLAIFLIVVVVGLGALYIRLHYLPRHLAERGHYVQFEVISVLCLLAMFTHNNAFWIAALFLALVPVPDFVTPFGRIAESLSRIAERWTSPATRLLRHQDEMHETRETAVANGHRMSRIKIAGISDNRRPIELKVEIRSAGETEKRHANATGRPNGNLARRRHPPYRH